MFKRAKKNKTAKVESYGIDGPYADSFFSPFKRATYYYPNSVEDEINVSAFNDAKQNVKAIVLYPVVNAFLSVESLLKSLRNLFFAAANILSGVISADSDDLFAGVEALGKSIGNFIDACYFAVSIVIDCLDSLIRFITHSFATLTQGALNAGKAISACFANEEQQSPNIEM